MSAKSCAACHQDIYQEWQTTIHSEAWTDPYFQVDWKFDGSQHSCRMCHTPLDRQLPDKVLGYRDTDKWDPILKENPDFDPKLQHEGVTCAACHYREGKIVGVMGDTQAPHEVQRITDPNQVCVRCHVVEGDRWDTFFRFPPCGTVAEIESTLARPPDKEDLEYVASLMQKSASDGGPKETLSAAIPLRLSEQEQAFIQGESGERKVGGIEHLGCVQCHMPLVQRPLVPGGPIRDSRRHLWRGGHDPQMVKGALSIEWQEDKSGTQRDVLTITTTVHL
ncbi:MAG: hypothetical protein HUJ30_01230, partial [Gammaproteobacteria bacterium]|nr:hypothetical protein [Gammaproteobacteria bacterium]